MTAHRARSVENENHLARGRFRGVPGGGRQHHGQQVNFIGEIFAEQRHQGLGCPGGPPFQFEIPVGGEHPVRQRNITRALAHSLDGKPVRRGGDGGELYARPQRDADSHRVQFSNIRMRHRGPGVPRTGVFRRVRGHQPLHALRRKAGRHHGREAQPEMPLIVFHKLEVIQRHRHRPVGADIGDIGGEHVGPVLFDQGRAFPLFAGRGKYLARRLAFADFGDDFPPGAFQRHTVDRGIFRQGKEIAPLKPVFRRVEEFLRDPDPGYRAADRDIDLGAEERGGNMFPGGYGFEEQHTAFHVFRRYQSRIRRRRYRCNEANEKQKCVNWVGHLESFRLNQRRDQTTRMRFTRGWSTALKGQFRDNNEAGCPLLHGLDKSGGGGASAPQT